MPGNNPGGNERRTGTRTSRIPPGSLYLELQGVRAAPKNKQTDSMEPGEQLSAETWTVRQPPGLYTLTRLPDEVEFRWHLYVKDLNTGDEWVSTADVLDCLVEILPDDIGEALRVGVEVTSAPDGWFLPERPSGHPAVMSANGRSPAKRDLGILRRLRRRGV